MRGFALLVAVLVALAATPVAVAPTNGVIAYLREPADPKATPYGHIWTMNPDGSGQSDRTPAGILDVRSIAWSPNGAQLAFSALHLPNGDLDVLDSENGSRISPRTATPLPGRHAARSSSSGASSASASSS